MKEIYIVLTNTGTILSKIVKYWTKDRNTHASIGLDRGLKKLYSFGRLNPYNAFLGGFVREGINKRTFKRFSNTTTQVYSLSVTDEHYDRIVEIIKEFHNQRKIYKFNILGLMLAGFNKKIERKNSFYCSEFVRYVLCSSGSNTDEYPPVIKPEDFKKIDNIKLVYEGLLKEYKF